MACFWDESGLPPCCRAVFESRGITEPYDWQRDVVREGAGGGNLVFSQPTSAGKTFVVEALILRRMLAAVRDKKPSKILYIVPYKSLAVEKAASLQAFADHHKGFHVECFQGPFGRVPLKKRTTSVIVATLEKADCIVSSMILEKRLHELDMVVAEEVHFLLEPGRGPILETVLSLLVHFRSAGQLIAMSATIPNIHDLADWLNARVLTGSDRPVALAESVEDPSLLVALVRETVDDGESVIVFCGTKKSTENVAAKLRGSLGGASVAFHHSGVGAEEREAIEEAFRERYLRVVVATTTLATGVNLPARRVIVNTMMVGNQPLLPIQFKQMAGRAGRLGLDTRGEAILLAYKNRQNEAAALLRPLEQEVHSLMRTEAEKGHMLRLALGCVCACDGKADGADVHVVLCLHTLAGIQGAAYDVMWALNLLEELEALGMVEKEFFVDYSSVYRATDLGWATFVSTLPIRTACEVYEDLDRERKEGIVLVDQLHLLYLITPFERLRDPDWGMLRAALEGFSDAQARIAAQVGVSEQYVCCRENSAVGPRDSPERKAAQRLWAALMLQELVDEADVAAVADKYGYDRGGVEDLQGRASAFASMIGEFAENVGFGDLAGLFHWMHSRVAFGAKREIMELCCIPQIGSKRARMLWVLGYKTVEDIGEADPDEMAARIKATHGFGLFSQRGAEAAVRAARDIIAQKIAALGGSA